MYLANNTTITATITTVSQSIKTCFTASCVVSKAQVMPSLPIINLWELDRLDTDG